jgi:hypothetical protein
MKKLSILALVIGLTGCASTDFSKIQRSSATVSNLEFTESISLEKRKHKIDLSFTYDIKDYNEINGLYFCSVQFKLTNEDTLTSFKKGKIPCSLDQATGDISIKWASPFDKSLNVSKDQLSKIKYPLAFFLAIHQKTNRKESYIIGKSKINTSAI